MPSTRTRVPSSEPKETGRKGSTAIGVGCRVAQAKLLCVVSRIAVAGAGLRKLSQGIISIHKRRNVPKHLAVCKILK